MCVCVCVAGKCVSHWGYECACVLLLASPAAGSHIQAASCRGQEVTVETGTRRGTRLAAVRRSNTNHGKRSGLGARKRRYTRARQGGTLTVFRRALGLLGGLVIVVKGASL